MASADLIQALANIDAKILSITANPKPNYSIDGQTVSWGDFLKQLMDARQNLTELINIDQGPQEVVWEGVT
jgi:hypothetical protein